MSAQLLPLPLTERSVHLCVDVQRIFSAEGPWPTRNIVTDGLSSYPAAMKEIGNADRQELVVGSTSRGEFASAFSTTRASHAAVPKRQDAQKFSSVHAQFHNHFNQEGHLVARVIYKQRRSAALAEWCTVKA